VYFALRYPTAKVIAIEPDPDNFRILRRNSELFPGIVPINAALWNSDDVVSLLDGGSGGWGMQVREPGASPSAPVRSMRMQTLLSMHQITRIDLLKIDVEGAEQEILQDASAWIDRVAVVCAELHDRFRPGCSKAFEEATAGFPVRWRRGELVCVAREGAVSVQ
jgi:FkbM family methyltransferase